MDPKLYLFKMSVLQSKFSQHWVGVSEAVSKAIISLSPSSWEEFLSTSAYGEKKKKVYLTFIVPFITANTFYVQWMKYIAPVKIPVLSYIHYELGPISV